jgi:hypothetical protein
MRRTALFIVLLSLIGGCCLLWLRPFPTKRQVAKARAEIYQGWYDQTTAAYEAFRHLAGESGWRMYVRTYEGPPRLGGLTAIGRLDCGESRYTPLYEPQKRRFIETVTPFRGGRAAFIEYTRKSSLLWGTTSFRDFELGVLRRDGSVTKVRIPDIDVLGDIAIGDRYVVFSEMAGKVWLYDVHEGALREMEKPKGWEGIVGKLAMLRDRFLLIGSGVPGTRLVVVEVERPDAVVSSTEEVWKMLVVGDHVVVQKNNDCFLYDPQSGGTEHLTPGRLVRPVGRHEFLFCEPDAHSPGILTGNLYRYNVITRSAAFFWQPPKEDGGFRTEPGEEKGYDYAKLILSPDRRFLFVPREIPPYTIAEVLLSFECDVYDLMSGERCGSFLTIHEGRFCFEFLGWVDQREAAVPERDDAP